MGPGELEPPKQPFPPPVVGDVGDTDRALEVHPGGVVVSLLRSTRESVLDLERPVSRFEPGVNLLDMLNDHSAGGTLPPRFTFGPLGA